MGSRPPKMEYEYTPSPVQDPFSVYVPFESLTEAVVQSVISVATRKKIWPNENNSERTLLIFLLAINKKLDEIEYKIRENEAQVDKNTVTHVEQVRKWLVDNKNQPLNWDKLQQTYDELVHSNKQYDSKRYNEFLMKPYFDGMKRSREYMTKSRKDGFKPEELKVYWNAEQLENLCPKSGEDSDAVPPHDPSDEDAVENLRKFPVKDRHNRGEIKYVADGIEKAVFDIPDDVQIIVLNFANEQSPGGGYLRHAIAQEEVILYNSDGYRSLLDLKYGRMGGGYAIPEFGLAYVRDICFYDRDFDEKFRKADMLVSACYCLNGEQLYANPRTEEEWKKNNLAKFRAFMAAAVANTKGNGKKTYLLLGPIGTGAFGNDVGMIGEVFREVLKMKMMHSEKAVQYAFEEIWFVSIDGWKNDIFKSILQHDKADNTENN